ncbi:MAG: UDP-N-acetylmuramate--L-alanine ligase [Clostridia bacterium]|nr:UDP-N-acetylmuramate--L-alanine ligase [Clostridia bacterium]
MRFGDHKLIHFIGIGGCSMNGIAQVLKHCGFGVQGSDSAESPFTERLRELSIPVAIGHSPENLGEADLVVYSAAIKPDNCERVEARRRGIPEIERSVALGMLSEGYADVVGIAGCHGKTTITSMLALIAEHCSSGKYGAHRMDATVHVGGNVDFLRGGVRIGAHDVFITEACEYVRSFLTLRPTIALINNIDDDHLDYYGDIKEIAAAFGSFIDLLPDDGLLIGCSDDAEVARLMRSARVRSISYGMVNADYTPHAVEHDPLGCPSFDVLCGDERLGRIELSVIGDYNMLNALGAIAVARALDAPFEAIRDALCEYRLTQRRFQYMGERDGIKVFHDYAHHPNEIQAVLEGAKRYPHGRLICVFQCNSYSRARTLFCGDRRYMDAADLVLVPDIYPGRERDTGEVHARDIVAALKRTGANAQYVATFEEIREYLNVHGRPGDMVITLGSGDVFFQTRKLL